VSRDAAAYLLDMPEACERIARCSADADRTSLLADTKTIDALAATRLARHWSLTRRFEAASLGGGERLQWAGAVRPRGARDGGHVMRKNSLGCGIFGSWLLVAAGLAGCNGTEPSVESVLGREEANECGGSVPRNLANLAAASASELGRWEVRRDFRIAAGRLALSSEGEARCRSGCSLIRAVLALQEPATAAADHDPAAFTEALLHGYETQRVVEAKLGAIEDHELAHVGQEPSACGQLFWYEAERANCAGECRYAEPEALASKLVFAGYPDNPYLAFESATDFEGRKASLVAIDPTWDPVPPPPGCSLSCTKYSTSSLVGKCCQCNGVKSTFVQSPTANIYKCNI
jgi:hypothetical protein